MLNIVNLCNIFHEKYVINPNYIKNPQIQYYFMLLTNLTISEEGQARFLNLENEKIKGVVFMKMLDKYFENIYSEEFNFCSNLIANITSHKDGRQLLLEYNIFKIFLIHFDKMNNFKLTNILRMFRNSCFEFEKYKENLLEYDVIYHNSVENV
jgi:hypothetical protein